MAPNFPNIILWINAIALKEEWGAWLTLNFQSDKLDKFGKNCIG